MTSHESDRLAEMEAGRKRVWDEVLQLRRELFLKALEASAEYQDAVARAEKLYLEIKKGYPEIGGVQ